MNWFLGILLVLLLAAAAWLGWRYFRLRLLLRQLVANQMMRPHPSSPKFDMKSLYANQLSVVEFGGGAEGGGGARLRLGHLHHHADDIPQGDDVARRAILSVAPRLAFLTRLRIVYSLQMSMEATRRLLAIQRIASGKYTFVDLQSLQSPGVGY